MKIGLIDVDSLDYPNIALMKISAYFKGQGDEVEWYHPAFKYDRVYLSKIFDFTPDYPFDLTGEAVVIKGGTGYCINSQLPPEIEEIYPDYSIYEDQTKDTAYGYLTRGCPRECGFCIVSEKEGKISRKVADLSQFWRGQEKIELLDPNILASKDCLDLLKQLEESGAKVNFTQGLDIRLMTKEKAQALNRINTRYYHFAWDNYEDFTYEKLKEFRQWTDKEARDLIVYVLVNYNTTFEQDLDRIYKLRELGYQPFVMRYNKASLKRGHRLNALARWVNNKFVWNRVDKFEDYSRDKY